MKKYMCLSLVLLFLFSSLYSQDSNVETLNSEGSLPDPSLKNATVISDDEADFGESKDDKTKVDDQMVQILKWGLNLQIKGALKEITDRKQAQYAEYLVPLYHLNKDEIIFAMIFKYFIEIEDYRLVKEGVELLKYYESEPDILILNVVDYLVAGQEDEQLILLNEDMGELFWSLYEYGSEIIRQRAIKGVGEVDASSFLEKLKLEYEDYALAEALKPDLIRVIGKLGGFSESPWIIELLNSEISKSEKWACCEALGQMGEESLFDEIYNQFGMSKDPYMRMKIVDSLGGYSEKSIEKILDLAIRDSFWRVRKSALQLSAEKGYLQYIPRIIFKVKTEPENVVKQEAIKALGILKSDEALEFLKESALDSKIALGVRKGIIQSLFKYDTVQFLDTILEVVKTEEEKSNSKLIPYIAASAGKSENDGLDPLFEQLLESDKSPILFAAVQGMQVNNLILKQERLEELYEKNKSNYLGKAIAKLLDIEEDDKKDDKKVDSGKKVKTVEKVETVENVDSADEIEVKEKELFER